MAGSRTWQKQLIREGLICVYDSRGFHHGCLALYFQLDCEEVSQTWECVREESGSSLDRQEVERRDTGGTGITYKSLRICPEGFTPSK